MIKNKNIESIKQKVIDNLKTLGCYQVTVTNLTPTLIQIEGVSHRIGRRPQPTRYTTTLVLSYPENKVIHQETKVYTIKKR